MHNAIGIMQGRLVPSPSGKMQAFPLGSWEEEFVLAGHLGFNAIEWLLDAETDVHNPLWETQGRERIRQIMREHRLIISSVCADYMQKAPLSILDRAMRYTRAMKLKAVMKATNQVGARCLLIPCFENNLEPDSPHAQALCEALLFVLETAQELGVVVGLEMDWPAAEQLRLISRVGHPALGIYYDLGNATSLGYSPSEDLLMIGSRLVGVHIKDQKVGGNSVFLGQGDTDFSGALKTLIKIGYEGSFILETPRGSDPINTAHRHLAFLRQVMKETSEGERSN